MKEVITSPGAPQGTGPYSPALKVGGFVFVSGHGPLDPETHAVVGDTFAEQAERTSRAS